jgi:hypothetical protein
VAHGTTRCVADYDETSSEHAITDDARFTVVLPHIFDLDGGAFEYQGTMLSGRERTARKRRRRAVRLSERLGVMANDMERLTYCRPRAPLSTP